MRRRGKGRSEGEHEEREEENTQLRACTVKVCGRMNVIYSTPVDRVDKILTAYISICNMLLYSTYACSWFSQYIHALHL